MLRLGMRGSVLLFVLLCMLWLSMHPTTRAAEAGNLGNATLMTQHDSSAALSRESVRSVGLALYGKAGGIATVRLQSSGELLSTHVSPGSAPMVTELADTLASAERDRILELANAVLRIPAVAEDAVRDEHTVTMIDIVDQKGAHVYQETDTRAFTDEALNKLKQALAENSRGW